MARQQASLTKRLHFVNGMEFHLHMDPIKIALLGPFIRTAVRNIHRIGTLVSHVIITSKIVHI